MLIDYYSFKTKQLVNQNAKKILVIESNERTIDQRINFILNNVDLNGLILKKESNAIEQFEEQFKTAELLISESELITQLFECDQIKIEDFCLIIFNDIHQNFDNLNNLKIMSYYEQAKVKPRILSFCISLINNESTTKRMNALIKKMEKNYHSKCKSSVTTYNYKPKEIIIKIRLTSLDLVLSNEFKNACSLISSLIKCIDESKIKSTKNDNTTTTINLKNTRRFLFNFIYIIEQMGIWPAKLLTEIYVNELSELVSIHMQKDRNYASALSSLNSLFNYLGLLLNAILKNYGIHEQIYKLSSTKLRCLVSILSENLNESNQMLATINQEKDLRRSKKMQDAQFSCIIFAKRKEIVRVLAAFLKEVQQFDIEKCFNLKVESLICEKRIAKNFEELKPNKKQEEIIAKFKKLEYNTLVVTSSFEEKLDLPKCNLVIRFDLPSSSKEYIQSKERTRPENSKLVFIVNENAREEDKLLEFVQQEKILRLKFKNDSEHEDEDKRMKDLGVDLEQIEKQMPIFKPENKKNARSANASISIAVINRYCSKLPSDSFTKLFPRWKLNERLDEATGHKLYQCLLSLPINSPIRYEIKGDYFLTRKLAKKSVAIKACQKLYECGELDEYLIPICKENIKCVETELELIENANEENVDNSSNRNLVGTTKKRRYYNKKTATSFTGQPLNANEDYYFYIFVMRLTCPIPEEQNTRGRKIIDPADFDRNFGLLIRNRLPKICKFPVFTRSGEVLVDLKQVPYKIQLNSEQFDRLVKFHKFTFKDVLLLEKYPMKFDYVNSDCTYFVVPITYDIKLSDDKLELARIDWQFIKIVEDYQYKLANGGYLKSGDLTSKDREKFEFKKELYEDAVIKPLYHKTDHHFYFYVAEIFDDLNPLSSFTNELYDTFADYYKTKYNTEITNLTQPLLDVDYTSARLNLLTPRYVNRKGITLPMSTAKTKTEIRNNLEKKQLLVPEICIVHPFPSSFWKKAVCLPSMLYRVNCLLLAEELRKEVAIAVNIGKIELDEDENWEPLNFGWTLQDVLNNCLDKNSINQSSKNSLESTTTNLKSSLNSSSNGSSSKKDELNGKLNDVKLNDAIKNKQQSLDLSSDSTDPLGDFIIDVFDPSKYNIKDVTEEDEEDDFDSDDSVMEHDFHQNLMTSNSKGFNLNNPFDMNSFGSFSISAPNQPLAIENNESNCKWIDQTNKFLNCGLDGLTSISGMENLNLKSLSEDIAKINEVEDVDLIDEYESDENLTSGIDEIEDEEDAEFDPAFKPKNSFFSKPSFAQDEFMFEIQTNGLMIDNKIVDTNLSELTKICNNLKEEELFQNTIVEELNLDYFEIRSFSDKLAVSAVDKEDKTDNNKTNNNEIKLNEITKLLKDVIGFDELTENSNKSKSSKAIKSTKNIDKKLNYNNDQQQDKEDEDNFQPGFGELLPIKKLNKDNQKKSTIDCNEMAANNNSSSGSKSSTFKIKFDPFKKDQTDCLGPDPSMILQALTMSNASDGINLERLETVGDSFLKYAVTAYLYCTYNKIHEGKLSHLRSKQISNSNLFRLGKEKCLGEMMIATKFEPSENWLPPGFVIPKCLEQVLVDLSSQNSANVYDLNALKHLCLDNISEFDLRQEIEKHKAKCIISSAIKDAGSDDENGDRGYENALALISKKNKTRITDLNSLKDATHIPYNLLTQHSIPDKSIADCVESLIGAYLISCGTKSALLFMKWLGLKVMPEKIDHLNKDTNDLRWYWLPKVKFVFKFLNF